LKAAPLKGVAAFFFFPARERRMKRMEQAQQEERRTERKRKPMEKKSLPERRLLTVEEIAAMLSMSPKSIYNGCLRGAKYPFPIKPKRIRRLLRFDVRDVERYLESL
jgi:predicted DNA-binding transcriptional regulator AlpA